MTKHFPLSPSSRHRWKRDACPGSVQLINSLKVTSTPTPYASEGTFAHDIAAACLLTGHDAHRYVGAVSGDGEHVVTAEMVNAIQVYLDFARRMQGQVHVERTIDFSDTGGTPDLVIDDPWRTLCVVDFKYGAGDFVDVKDNPQLKMYAVLASRASPVGEWQQVMLAIVQPRYESDTPVRILLVPADQLDEWEADLALDLAAAKAEEAPLRPSEAACQYCPARPQCPARNAIVVDALETAGLRPPAALSRDQLAWMLTHSKLITRYLSDCYAYASGLAEHGEKILGFKLVEAMGNRTWLDEDAVIRRLRNKGLKIDQYRPRSLISPAQAEKLVGKGVLDAYTARPKSMKLVPDSDSREAISVDITQYLQEGNSDVATD